MRSPPKVMQPILDLAADPATTVEQLRAELQKQDKERLKRNGFHVLQSLAVQDDLAEYVIKFACVHEALGSDDSVYAMLIDAQFLRGESPQTLSDEQACRVARFLLDSGLLRRFPGLIYKACRAGWRECGSMLFAEGIYKPLEWQGYSGDGPEQETNLAQLLLDIVKPSLDDLRIIRAGFKDNGAGAQILDRAIRHQAQS